MATVKENITVKELTKFGFKVGDEFVNYSKLLPEADKTKVVPGVSFDAELYVADSGKRYLNKILTQATPSQARPGVAVAESLAKATDIDRAKKFTPKFNKTEASSATATSGTSMSKAEWQAKDRSQLIGGLSHDAAAVVAAMVGVESLDAHAALVRYAELLTGMLSIREELK